MPEFVKRRLRRASRWWPLPAAIALSCVFLSGGAPSASGNPEGLQHPEIEASQEWQPFVITDVWVTTLDGTPQGNFRPGDVVAIWARVFNQTEEPWTLRVRLQVSRAPETLVEIEQRSVPHAVPPGASGDFVVYVVINEAGDYFTRANAVTLRTQRSDIDLETGDSWQPMPTFTVTAALVPIGDAYPALFHIHSVLDGPTHCGDPWEIANHTTTNDGYRFVTLQAKGMRPNNESEWTTYGQIQSHYANDRVVARGFEWTSDSGHPGDCNRNYWSHLAVIGTSDWAAYEDADKNGHNDLAGQPDGLQDMYSWLGDRAGKPGENPLAWFAHPFTHLCPIDSDDISTVHGFNDLLKPVDGSGKPDWITFSKIVDTLVGVEVAHSNKLAAVGDFDFDEPEEGEPGYIKALLNGWRVAPLIAQDLHYLNGDCPGPNSYPDDYTHEMHTRLFGIPTTRTVTESDFIAALRARKTNATWDQDATVGFSLTSGAGGTMGSIVPISGATAISLRIDLKNPDGAMSIADFFKFRWQQLTIMHGRVGGTVHPHAIQSPDLNFFGTSQSLPFTDTVTDGDWMYVKAELKNAVSTRWVISAPIWFQIPPSAPSWVSPCPQTTPPMKPLSFVVRASDPNDDGLFVTFNWGDNSPPTRVGPLPSGSLFASSHQYPTVGSYFVTVTAGNVYSTAGGPSPACRVDVSNGGGDTVSLDATADTYVEFYFPVKNNCTDHLYVGHDDFINFIRDRTWLKFDLTSAIPEGVKVTSARLELTSWKVFFDDPSVNQTILVHNGLDPWPGNGTECSLTYSNQPGRRRTPVDSRVVTGPGRYAWNIDVAVVQQWLSDPSSNFGVVLAALSDILGTGASVTDVPSFLSKETASVPGDRPKLIVQFQRLPDYVASVGGPGSGIPGKSITVDVATLNQGTGDATVPSHTHVFLSRNQVVGDADDVFLRDDSDVPPLVAGAAHAHPFDVTIPANTTEGDYFICARADEHGVVTESNEGNNVGWYPVRILLPKPDYVIFSIRSQPTDVYPGESISAEVVTANFGTGDATVPSTTKVYLSPDCGPDDSDPVVIPIAVPALKAGEFFAPSQPVVIPVPLSLPPATYHVLAYADATNAIQDSDETNNADKCLDIIVKPPQPTYALTVLSSPESGCSTVVTPPDNNGAGGGSTPFTRIYSNGTPVTLDASGTCGGLSFDHWVVDGVARPVRQNPITITMDADHTAVAVYLPPTWMLTVQSSPSSGCSVTVSPADNNENGNGTTSFIRTYNNGRQVTLDAFGTCGERSFDHWVVDGTSRPAGQDPITVLMDTNHTATVVYATIVPPPSLLSPANGLTTGCSPVFDWTDVSGATGYDIAFDACCNGSWYEQLSVAQSMYQGRLRNFSCYRWRVRTRGATGTSIWSAEWTVRSRELRGDVNADGAVNSSDAVLLLKYLAGSLASLPNLAQADVDFDGDRDPFDVSLILAQAVFKVPVLCAGSSAAEIQTIPSRRVWIGDATTLNRSAWRVPIRISESGGMTAGLIELRLDTQSFMLDRVDAGSATAGMLHVDGRPSSGRLRIVFAGSGAALSGRTELYWLTLRARSTSRTAAPPVVSLQRVMLFDTRGDTFPLR